jgi:hypothetical protein
MSLNRHDGVIGACTAYFLSLRGIEVIVIEGPKWPPQHPARREDFLALGSIEERTTTVGSVQKSAVRSLLQRAAMPLNAPTQGRSFIDQRVGVVPLDQLALLFSDPDRQQFGLALK